MLEYDALYQQIIFLVVLFWLLQKCVRPEEQVLLFQLRLFLADRLQLFLQFCQCLV